MRFLALFTLVTLPLASQNRESGGETLQSLLAEVRQLRFAIERSTLLGTRMQIPLQRIQVHEGRATRLSQELDRVRRELAELQNVQPRAGERIKELEQRASHATDAAGRRQAELELKEAKLEQEALTTREQQARAREAEMAAQVRDEQGRLTELHDRVNQMERALDDALKQIGGRN